MKNHNNKHPAKLLTLALGFCIAAFSFIFSSCVTREEIGDGGGENEAWVLLTVKHPQPSLPSTRTATRQTASESDISALRILILEEGNNGYAFSYQVMGSEIEPSGNPHRFRALLRTTDTPLKLLVLINSEQAFGSYEPSPGDSEAEIKNNLEIPFTSAGMTGNLPMYGELIMPDGVGAGNNSVQMTALRAIARVDVVKDLDPDSDEFVLEEVHIFRANDKIKLDHVAFADPDVPVVFTPTVPSDAAFLTAPVTKVAVGGTDEIRNVYLPESYPAQNESDKIDGVTVIVVGGRWGGVTNPVTYYRADFYPDMTDARFGEVLRNHRYTINIKKVTAAGWNTPQEAADNYASSIVVEVAAWEDFASDVYFGENRFALSSRDISLRYVANRTRSIDVESTLEYTIQWIDNQGQPASGETSQPNTTISNDAFDVTIVKDAADPQEVTHLSFRTRNNNYTTSVIERTLRISVENWSIDVTVSQDNTALYSSRHFNVLSGIDSGSYPTGHLGTTTTLPPGYVALITYGGLAMRRILDVHFSPTGEVKIGGFAFDQVDDSNTHLTATSTANLQEMERIIRMQNVIYLTYEVGLSDQVANLILTWLQASPKHVLILGCDDASTNANMLNKQYISADGAWTFGIQQGAYSRATETTQTTEFFSGPFGNVGQSTIARLDGTAGYMAAPASGVTPLIMSSGHGMVVGVNKQKRIVYLGDVNLFMYPQLYNETGTMDGSHDLDKLMTNTWAWIVEQLIYGDE